MRKSDLFDDLLEKIQSNPEYQESVPCFVSIYRTERCYGGPEEGGWWYDAWSHEGGIPFPNREAAEAFLEQAKREVEEQNRAEAPRRALATANIPEGPDPYPDTEGYIPLGWSDGGTLKVQIEDRAGEFDDSNKPRPRYE